MTPNSYMRELAEAITRQEDLSDKEAQQVLYELALRIYALLLRRLPENRFERYLRWPELRREITLWLLDANDLLATAAYNRLITTETAVTQITTRLFDLSEGQLPPRPVAQLLEETTVLGTSMSRLYARNATTGLSPWVTQMLQLLERSVIAMFFKDPPTAEVAQKVVGSRTRAGKEVPVVTKGTVANAWRERQRNITAAVLWAPVAPTAQRAALVAAQTGHGFVTQWRWNAVLDPKTCPVCRPLHNTTAPTPQEFPGGPPPLHPRCVIGSTPVSTGTLIAAMRTAYSGDLVTITTEHSGRFTVTAQHPMLTTNGWRRAHSVCDGEYLIRHTFNGPTGEACSPDLNKLPPLAEDVFSALLSASPVPAITVPASAMHFHPDGVGVTGEVEIVFADWELQERLYASGGEGLLQLDLVARDSKLPVESGLSDFDSLFLRLNAAASGSVSLFQQSETLLTGHVGLTEIHRFAAVANRQPQFIEPTCDDVPAAAVAIRHCLNAHTSLVQSDKILNVEVVPATVGCHVYDFSTFSGIYSIGQLLTHNCRCVVMPLLP